MKVNTVRLYSFIVILAGLVFLPPSSARADCDLGGGNGTRPVGRVVYNEDYDVLQVCRSDGVWQALGPIGSGPGDTTPDAFSFTDQIGVAPLMLIESNTINITGIDTATNVAISGDGNPEFRINGGSWVTSGTITDGQTLQLRLTANATNDMTNSATVTVGTGSDQWDVTSVSGGPSEP